MGMKSVESRLENGAIQEIAQAQLTEKAPLAGALVTMFPKLRKILTKDPGLLDWALSHLAGPQKRILPTEDFSGNQDFKDRLNKFPH